MKSALKYLFKKDWFLARAVPFTNVHDKEHISVSRVRHELLFWGVDTSDVTDDEIRDSVMKLSKKVSGFGLSSDELSKVLTQASKT